MRGIAHQPHIPLFEERYKLKPACLAVYPMYKGLAQLVGMKKIEGPATIAEQFERYLIEYDNFDFFFIHYKYTDKYGEDGNFLAKMKAIEDFDAALPILLRKKPDVLVVTGDHSTPCALHGHSWHPQPVLLHSAVSGSDKLERFTETGANLGSLGVFKSKFLIRQKMCIRDSCTSSATMNFSSRCETFPSNPGSKSKSNSSASAKMFRSLSILPLAVVMAA